MHEKVGVGLGEIGYDKYKLAVSGRKSRNLFSFPEKCTTSELDLEKRGW